MHININGFHLFWILTPRNQGRKFFLHPGGWRNHRTWFLVLYVVYQKGAALETYGERPCRKIPASPRPSCPGTGRTRCKDSSPPVRSDSVTTSSVMCSWSEKTLCCNTSLSTFHLYSFHIIKYVFFSFSESKTLKKSSHKRKIMPYPHHSVTQSTP